jgi:hypothetical protein
MPGTNLVVVDHALRAARAVRRVRPRSGAYVLMGLALSGWMGFLVLAGVLLAMKSAKAPGPEPVSEGTKREEARKLATSVQVEPQQAPPQPVPKAMNREQAGKLVTSVQVEPEHAPPPVSAAPPYELGAYEERRRVQERMRQADVADHEDGNVSASRSIYEYAARRGWAQAALALAFTYDPHELQRRGVTVAADPAKARACYTKARELMEATVAFYLSRFPSGGREERC